MRAVATTAHHRRRNRLLGRAALALVLSLLGHAVFVAFLLFLSLLHLTPPSPRKPSRPLQPVQFARLTPEQWAKNRGGVDGPDARTKAQEQDSPKREEKKPEAMPEGQVVDVAPGNGQESEDAKYLAERSNKVEKETRAREQTPFYRNAMPHATSTTRRDGSGRDDVERRQLAGNNGIGDDDRPLREEARRVLEIPDVERRQEVALKQEGDGPGQKVANRTESAEIVGNSNRLKIAPGGLEGSKEASAGRAGKPGVANLLPSAAVLDKITGGAPNDHLDGVEEGDGTYLNTKEWKYASFFNRVKQSVGMHWDPGSKLRQRDPTGRIYGGRDRYTVLNVKLNERGMVKDIYVEKSCGLDFLDLEAIQSFERAQPFPNPPPGLIAADSTVQFSFGFFLEMGGGPRLRLFRSAN